MIEVTVANRHPVPTMITWLSEHGVDYATGYSIGMDGKVAYNEDIEFYPKFMFTEGVDEAVLLEFSLRFS